MLSLVPVRKPGNVALPMPTHQEHAVDAQHAQPSQRTDV
jgi:hypothetical protein